jgi:hypothetical protein
MGSNIPKYQCEAVHQEPLQSPQFGIERVVAAAVWLSRVLSGVLELY